MAEKNEYPICLEGEDKYQTAQDGDTGREGGDDETGHECGGEGDDDKNDQRSHDVARVAKLRAALDRNRGHGQRS